MVSSILPMLAFVAGAMSIPADGQARFGVDARGQQPPGMMSPIAATADGSPAFSAFPLAGTMLPGTVSVTTIETTEEDEDGNLVQTSLETRIEPVAAVAYAPDIRPAAYQVRPAIYTPPVTALQIPTPHLDLDATVLALLDPGDRVNPQSLRIARDHETGHFIAPIRINGVNVRAIIDTGAQETILSARDARVTGANRDVVSSEQMAGIGGYTTLDVTRVRSMEVAGQQLGGFTAAIGQEGIPFTLLGQTEIARLGRIEIENGVMTITPKAAVLASR